MPQSAQRVKLDQQQGQGQSNLAPLTALPSWLPGPMRLYLDHTEAGQSLRALARRHGLNASTVLRQVRRCELRRDDPLVDQALSAFHDLARNGAPVHKDDFMQHKPIPPQINDTMIAQQAPRLLRRLAEPGAFLAVAEGLDKAAVMRKLPDGRLMRMAVVERAIAQVFAVKEWIALKENGKVVTYELTAAGRAELKARVAQSARQGMAEAGASFAGASFAGASFAGASFAGASFVGPSFAGADAAEAGEGPRRVRYCMAESPVSVLGRRRDKDGKPYLDPELVRAAERLREDFELSQMGTSVTQNWEGFLTGGVTGGKFGGQAGCAPQTPRDARARVAAALGDLGPDLGHIALRVCCYLEGVEEAEQRMGWAARSGKVVLRIALRRLARHYLETYGASGPLIG